MSKQAKGAAEFCAEYMKAPRMKLGMAMPQDGDVIHMGGPIMCEVMEAYLASHTPSESGDSAQTPPGFTYEADVTSCADCEYESAVHASHDHSEEGGSWEQYQHIKKRAEIEHNDH